MVTFDRPVEAKLIVRLENGEEWEAKRDDLAKFGYVERYEAYQHFRNALWQILNDAGLLDDGDALIRAAINPIRYLAEVASGQPEFLDHEDLAETRAQVQAIEQLLRAAGVTNGVSPVDALLKANS